MWRAEFDEFTWKQDGVARFVDQRPTSKHRHRDRVWPALSRYKRVRHPKRWTGHSAERMNRRIDAASLLTILRKWYPVHPLAARHTMICDLAQRPPRLDDFRMSQEMVRRRLGRYT